MSIPYDYDKKQNLVRWALRGVFTMDMLREYLEGVLEDDTIQPGFVEIAVFDGLEEVDSSYDDLRGLTIYWKRYIAKGCAGTILLAPTNLEFGLARMIQQILGGFEQADLPPFIVCRSEEDVTLAIDKIRGQHVY